MRVTGLCVLTRKKVSATIETRKDITHLPKIQIFRRFRFSLSFLLWLVGRFPRTKMSRWPSG